MNLTRILKIVYIIWFNFSFLQMKSVDNHISRYKRTLSSISNITNSIKNYFVNRDCIKYIDNQQLFQFNEQSGQIDLTGKLRIIVSIDALNYLTDRYQSKTFTNFSIYFFIVSYIQ